MSGRSSIRSRVVAGLLVLGLLAGAMLLWKLRQPPAPAVELDRSALVLKNGRLFPVNSEIPFTGYMTERYPGGPLQSRSSVKDGVLDGLSVGYYTNGVAEVEEHFKNGTSHGVRTKYYITGNKRSEAHVVNGKLDGVFRRWHQNGQLAEEVTMKNGAADGISTAYYTNGGLRTRVRLEEGKVVERQTWPESPGTNSVPSSS